MNRTNADMQQELVELLPDAIVVVSRDGRIVRVNAPVETLFGYSRAELLGQPIEALIPERYRERHVEQRAAYASNPYVRPMRGVLKLYGRRQDGSEFPVDIMLSPFDTEEGAMVVAVIRDATERKRAEETLRHQRDELAKAYEQLRELDRLQSKFISDVSHELRTPVANLHLYLSLLERGKADKRQHYLAILKEQVARLVNLVEDITDVSHLELDNLTATFGLVDLNAVAHQVVTELQPRAVAAGLTLTFHPDVNLPPVRAARDQLSRVVANLVANAISYTSDGLVRVSTYRTPDRVCLQVQDTGRGIDPEDMPHLFKRFYRGRNVSHIPGNGLGLAVAHEIVRLHGGFIEADSDAGQGSRFTASFPPA